MHLLERDDRRQLCLPDLTLGACRCDGAPDAGFVDTPVVAPDAGFVDTPVVAPDVAPSDTPVVAPDVVPDVASDLPPDVAPDVTPDVAPDVPAPEDCRVSRCAAGSYCDLGDGRCRPGCALDAECPMSSRCDAAAHRCVCVAGYHLCGAACAPDNVTASCGASCTPCPAVDHGTATCAAGACGTTCEAGRLLCGGACLACSDPNGAGSCEAGACRLRCNAGYHLCSDRCFRDDDVTHCGAACVACPTPGASSSVRSTCQGGVCEVACVSGYRVCDGVCQGVTTCTASRSASVIERDAQMRPGPLAFDARSAATPHLAYHAPGPGGMSDALRYWVAGSIQAVAMGDPGYMPAVLHAASPRGAIFTTRGTGPFNVGYYALGDAGWAFNQFNGAVGLDTRGSRSTLAVTRDGDHAAFSLSPCTTAADVYYAERVGGVWTATRVGTGGCVAAMALGADGSPRIALWDPSSSEGRSLGIMERGAGGTWSTRAAVFRATDTSYASVTASPTGQFALVYRNTGGYGYAAEATGWAPESAAYLMGPLFASIDIDVNGVARFLYATGYGNSGSSPMVVLYPHLCTRMGGVWTDEALPTMSYRDYAYPTMALSTTPAGRPVVAYQSPGEVGLLP